MINHLSSLDIVLRATARTLKPLIEADRAMLKSLLLTDWCGASSFTQGTLLEGARELEPGDEVFLHLLERLSLTNFFFEDLLAAIATILIHALAAV